MAERAPATVRSAQMTADIIVVGGGLHGCSVALQCAKKGLSVLVAEKNTVGRHASGVNAGGVRLLGRDPAEIPLSTASMEMWHGIADLVDDDCGFHSAPQVIVAETERELKGLTERAELVRRLGFNHEELLHQNELFGLLPAVSRHCVGGLVSFGDGFADPYRTTMAFKRKAESLGARFIEGCRVVAITPTAATLSVETTTGRFEGAHLVNCGGAWGHDVAAELGDPVPLEAVAPMMIVTSPLPRFCDAIVGAAGRPLSFKQTSNGSVLIGGGRLGQANLETGRSELDIAQLAKSARTAADIFPIVRESRIIRCWAGIEGRTPDGLPAIGRSSVFQNVLHAFGFSLHGFQLGPIVGAILAELITTGTTTLPITPFRIDRFAVQ